MKRSRGQELRDALTTAILFGLGVGYALLEGYMFLTGRGGM